MVRDRDQLLIGAMKRLVKRDNLCFHRFGPLVAGVERIKCFIYPLRGLVSSIIRYNILISFNSVSLRKSHTLLQEESIEALHILGELFRGLVSRAGGAQPAIGEARDAAQASIAAPTAYPDRQARLLHGFWF